MTGMTTVMPVTTAMPAKNLEVIHMYIYMTVKSSVFSISVSLVHPMVVNYFK